MMVDVTELGAPGTKTTVPPVLIIGPVIMSVFVSAIVEASVQVETPEAFEAEHVPYVLVLLVSVVENVGTIPATPVFVASFRVIVIVDVATPSATTGEVPVMFEFVATGPPATALKVTLFPVFTTGVTRASAFVPPTVDLSVQVAVPVKSVAEHTERVLPVPLAEKVGTVPMTGFMVASFRTIVTTDASTPSAL